MSNLINEVDFKSGTVSSIDTGISSSLTSLSVCVRSILLIASSKFILDLFNSLIASFLDIEVISMIVPIICNIYSNVASGSFFFSR